MNGFKPRPSRDAFVDQAPDAGAGSGPRGGKGVRTTIIVRPEILDRIDAAARAAGISRTAFMVQAAARAADTGSVS